MTTFPSLSKQVSLSTRRSLNAYEFSSEISMTVSLVAAIFAAFRDGTIAPGLQIDMEMKNEIMGNINLPGNPAAAIGASLGGCLSNRIRRPQPWFFLKLVSRQLATA